MYLFLQEKKYHFSVTKQIGKLLEINTSLLLNKNKSSAQIPVRVTEQDDIIPTSESNCE